MFICSTVDVNWLDLEGEVLKMNDIERNNHNKSMAEKENYLEENIESQSSNELDEETLFLVSQTFKALCNPTRIRILHLLFQNESSVSEIAEILNLSQSSVSHQLTFLKNLRLVKFRRDGKNLYYSHDDEHVMSILNQTIKHAQHC